MFQDLLSIEYNELIVPKECKFYFNFEEFACHKNTI